MPVTDKTEIVDKPIFVDRNGIGDTIKILLSIDNDKSVSDVETRLTKVYVNGNKQIMFGEPDEVKKLAKLLISALHNQEKFVNNENALDKYLFVGKIVTGYFDVIKVKYSELDNFVYIESNGKLIVNLTDAILTRKFIGGLDKSNKIK